MKYILSILLIGFFQPIAWAELPYCSDYGSYYECDIGKNCNCTIHAVSQWNAGLEGHYSFSFAPIEKKEYQCTFNISPLTFYLNTGASSFPAGVTYTVDETSGHLLKLNINAKNMRTSSTNLPIMIGLAFGAYDSPSILSAKCEEKLAT